MRVATSHRVFNRLSSSAKKRGRRQKRLLLCRDRKSTRLNSSHITIYTLSLHDALPIYTKDWLHTRELSRRAEIRQRSSAIGPEVRPWLGTTVLHRCEWLPHTESSTDCRPPRRSAEGGRNGSYFAEIGRAHV